MVGRHLQQLGICVQIYVAAVGGLVDMTKQVLFLTEAAGVFAGDLKHEGFRKDVLPRKPAFCCSDTAVPESAAREAQGRQARSLRHRADLTRNQMRQRPLTTLISKTQSVSAHLSMGYTRR